MSAINCGCDPEENNYKCERHREMSELTDIERPTDTTCGRAEKVALVKGLIDRAVRRDGETTLNEYQRSLHTYNNRHQECHALGLVGELGEVVDELKLEAVRDELKKDARWLSIDRDVVRDVLIAAGRVADMVKKATSHGVALDREKLKKELGDVLWYITAVASDNALTMDDIARANIEKLQKRYPQGFVKGGGARGPEGSAMNESQVDALRATLRENEPFLQAVSSLCKVPPAGWRYTRVAGHEGPCAAVPTYEAIPLGPGPAARQVSFACGCSETTIDGVTTRRYCPNGECRRLGR